MQEAPDLRITRFIVHVVQKDERAGAAAAPDEAPEGTRLEPSTRETPIDESFPEDFFQGYIVHTLTHELRRRATFQGPGGTVRRAFQELLDDPGSFVAASERIARHLHAAMSGRYRRWIKPGDVMVALVESAAEGTRPERWLAILKIDPSEALIREVRQEGEERWVVFQRREDRLPDFEENKIQKVAVIFERRHEEPEPHDLVLLDNNIKKTDVAHFFYDAFLDARLNRDAREMARWLAKGMKWVVSQQPLPPEVKRGIVSRLEARLCKGEPVTVEQLAREAADASGRPAPEAAQLAADLVHGLTTGFRRAEEPPAAGQSVPVDPQEAAEQSKTRTYRLDDGIEVSGPTPAVEEKVEITSSAGGEITVTIRSGSLEVA